MIGADPCPILHHKPTSPTPAYSCLKVWPWIHQFNLRTILSHYSFSPFSTLTITAGSAYVLRLVRIRNCRFTKLCVLLESTNNMTWFPTNALRWTVSPSSILDNAWTDNLKHSSVGDVFVRSIACNVSLGNTSQKSPIWIVSNCIGFLQYALCCIYPRTWTRGHLCADSPSVAAHARTHYPLVFWILRVLFHLSEATLLTIMSLPPLTSLWRDGVSDLLLTLPPESLIVLPPLWHLLGLAGEQLLRSHPSD